MKYLAAKWMQIPLMENSWNLTFFFLPFNLNSMFLAHGNVLWIYFSFSLPPCTKRSQRPLCPGRKKQKKDNDSSIAWTHGLLNLRRSQRNVLSSARIQKWTRQDVLIKSESVELAIKWLERTLNTLIINHQLLIAAAEVAQFPEHPQKSFRNVTADTSTSFAIRTRPQLCFSFVVCEMSQLIDLNKFISFHAPISDGGGSAKKGKTYYRISHRAHLSLPHLTSSFTTAVTFLLLFWWPICYLRMTHVSDLDKYVRAVLTRISACFVLCHVNNCGGGTQHGGASIFHAKNF